jgi:hypothetical protein
MATPTRALSNDSSDCRLIKLDAQDPKSPLVILQEGYVPGDPTSRMRLFYLQKDGFWIDEITRSKRREDDWGSIVFDTAAEALELLGSLGKSPLVFSAPVSEEDVRAYLARVRNGSPEKMARELLARYREAKAAGAGG